MNVIESNDFKISALKLIVTKSKKGNKYTALVCDLGYTRKYLCFSVVEIAELLDVLPSKIASLSEGEYAVGRK